MTAHALKTEEYGITEEPYYAPQGEEIALFEASVSQPPAGIAQGPHRLRQDALHGAHGLALEAPADHGFLSR